MASILVGESKGSYKGLQAWHQGRGARSAQDLQFQEIEIRNQYRFPLSEALSSLNAFQSEVSLYFSLANNRGFFSLFLGRC